MTPCFQLSPRCSLSGNYDFTASCHWGGRGVLDVLVVTVREMSAAPCQQKVMYTRERSLNILTLVAFYYGFYFKD